MSDLCIEGREYTLHLTENARALCGWWVVGSVGSGEPPVPSDLFLALSLPSTSSFVSPYSYAHTSQKNRL